MRFWERKRSDAVRQREKKKGAKERGEWGERGERGGQTKLSNIQWVSKARCSPLYNTRNHERSHLCVLQANTNTDTHNVSLQGTSSTLTDSDSMCVFILFSPWVCVCHVSSSSFGHLQFSGVERERERGILLLSCEPLQICMCTGAWCMWVRAWGWLSNQRSVS